MFDEDNALCQNCINTFKKIQEPYCGLCHFQLSEKKDVCFNCLEKKPCFQLNRSSTHFTHPVKNLIHDFKYRGKERLAHDFAQMLVQSYKNFPIFNQIEAILPVPLHTKTLKTRGYNQAKLLAQNFLTLLKNEKKELALIEDHVLIRAQLTPSQTLLSRQERFKNMENAFQVQDSIPILSKNILLIDDVTTTGATLNACAKILMEKGAKNVFALTVARD
ncbi:MAG: ComF family protein [Elusimicrobia bacterium]|nr:ComF family protein [Elusimicrobiota bacterium]